MGISWWYSFVMPNFRRFASKWAVVLAEPIKWLEKIRNITIKHAMLYIEKGDDQRAVSGCLSPCSMFLFHIFNALTEYIKMYQQVIWLMVSIPLKHMSSSMGRVTSHILWKNNPNVPWKNNPNVPNHQPV